MFKWAGFVLLLACIVYLVLAKLDVGLAPDAVGPQSSEAIPLPLPATGLLLANSSLFACLSDLEHLLFKEHSARYAAPGKIVVLEDDTWNEVQIKYFPDHLAFNPASMRLLGTNLFVRAVDYFDIVNYSSVG